MMFLAQYPKIGKRIICALVMLFSGLLASLPLVITQDGEAFLLPCALSGMIVGFCILPSFIKQHSSNSKSSAIWGGVISSICAVPIGLIFTLGISNVMDRGVADIIGNLVLFSGIGIILTSPFVIPIAILGAVVSQKICQNFIYIHL